MTRVQEVSEPKDEKGGNKSNQERDRATGKINAPRQRDHPEPQVFEDHLTNAPAGRLSKQNAVNCLTNAISLLQR